MAAAPFLELDDVSMRFGGVAALDGLSLSLGAGEVQGLIGPNGSGKSTAFNVITGILRPTDGDIRFEGESLVGLRPDQVAARGIARTFQHLRLFGALSVLDNVMIGTHLRADPPNAIETLFGLPRFDRHEAELRDVCMALLEQLQIADVAKEPAGTQPYGTQKRIDLARSLVAEPDVLLLDEPAAGLNEADSRHLLELIAEVQAARGIAILVVEHNMLFIAALCPRINVIDFGRLLAQGSPKAVRENPDVIAAYLGEPAAAAPETKAASATETAGESVASRPALEVKDLEVRYGAVPAVRNVDLTVAEGALTAIIGPNGAGKTTLLSCIAGLLPAHRGQLLCYGDDVTPWPCDRRVAAGVVMCPEGRRLFPSLSVRENLLLGAYSQSDAGRNRAKLDEIFALFPRVAERRDQLAGTLSGGEQQMVAIGRALMSNPRLLLLDEPSLGLAPNLVQQIFAMIGEIRGLGTTIVLVEQNATMALAIADHSYIMETGTVTFSGSAAVMRERHDIIDAYLG